MFFSIIIPLFNTAKFITKTIDSLILQTNKNFEIILIDDGSTDNSLQIALEALQKSSFPKSKIKKFVQDNSGVSVARNKGIKIAKGDYLIFLDGDDFLDSRLIETLNKKSESFDLVCWGYNKVDENLNTIDKFFSNYSLESFNNNGVHVLRKIISEKKIWIWTTSFAVKRKVLLKNDILFTPNCVNGEDQEVIFKSLIVSKSVKFIDSVYSFYLKRQTSITNTFSIKKFDAVYAIERVINFYKDRIKNNSQLSKVYINFDSHILNVFFETYYSLLTQSKSINKNLFIKDIKTYYPNLIKNICYYARKYNSSNLILKIKVKFFSFVPIIFLKYFERIINI